MESSRVLDESCGADMADLGGFSPRALQQLIRREVQNRHDSLSSIADADAADRSWPTRLRYAALLATAILHFLSAVVLSLVAVSTLPWAESDLVFVPSFAVAVLDALAGAFSVCIVWLRTQLPDSRCLMLSCLGLSVGTIPLTVAWVALGVYFGASELGWAGAWAECRRHHFSLLFLLPVCVTTFITSGLVIIVYISNKIHISRCPSIRL